MIVTTYNWPAALIKVITALSAQSMTGFEIIIADDGSSPETLSIVKKLTHQYPVEIQHIWQPDNGFQAAKIRNKAVAKARGEYLIFLDGDCIPRVNFIERHARLAEKNCLVVGNRILLSREFTDIALKNTNLSLHEMPFWKMLLLRKSRYCNRILPLLFLPLFPRKLRPFKWQGAKTCNLGLWKKDFLSVNGFDESYTGWGHEDSDLIIRLFKSGVKRKEGRFAVPVLHLWHKENDRSFQKDNLQRLLNRLADETTQASLGINQYLGDL